MTTAIWMFIAAAVLGLGGGFFLGWWLGRRRQAAHVADLRRELRDTYANAQRERTVLRQHYDAMISSFAQTAIRVVRDQGRQS